MSKRATFTGNFGVGTVSQSNSIDEIDKALFGKIKNPSAGGGLITTTASGEVQIGSFTLTPMGLTVADGATYEEWDHVGLILRQLERSIQWLLGDWCNYGDREWGEKYTAIAEATGYAEKTLREYAYVAANLSIRVDKLSFKHHQIVAGMDAEEQRYWLNCAVDGGWSTAELRKAINGNPQLDPPTPPRDVAVARQLAQGFAKGITRITEMSVHERAAFRVQAEKLRDQINRALQWIEDRQEDQE